MLGFVYLDSIENTFYAWHIRSGPFQPADQATPTIANIFNATSSIPDGPASLKRLFNNIISLFSTPPPLPSLRIYLLYLTNQSIYMGREIDRKKENVSVSHSESKRTVKCDSKCMQGAVLWTLVTPWSEGWLRSLPWWGVKCGGCRWQNSPLCFWLLHGWLAVHVCVCVDMGARSSQRTGWSPPRRETNPRFIDISFWLMTLPPFRIRNPVGSNPNFTNIFLQSICNWWKFVDFLYSKIYK